MAILAYISILLVVKDNNASICECKHLLQLYKTDVGGIWAISKYYTPWVGVLTRGSKQPSNNYPEHFSKQIAMPWQPPTTPQHHAIEAWNVISNAISNIMLCTVYAFNQLMENAPKHPFLIRNHLMHDTMWHVFWASMHQMPDSRGQTVTHIKRGQSLHVYSRGKPQVTRAMMDCHGYVLKSAVQWALGP